ncbi:MAG: ABC transporter ATP-binding protein [Methanobrevibacter sp.]|uniref:ABC transporter ATP-binding protein n=1 Tax=Methanobrevibacter sp. TaxID=66852 RepID=UPI001B1A4BB2|nr:ABC transporter ATP-binding protein [Methanobrevibacter sp.]MBO5150749.1 ABC transporter ATP-binding protein [Methanobrevibacter sp.]
MKRYFVTFKNLLQIANKKNFVIIQMFISSGLNNISSLLPPIATAGIIAMITSNNFNGIWFYVILYLMFYVMYFGSLHWNYYTYTVLADYYHLEVQKLLFEKVANNDVIFEKISKGKIIETCSDDIRYLVDVVDCVVKASMSIFKLLIIFLIFMHYNIIVATVVLLLDIIYLKLMNENSRGVSKFYEGTRKYEDKIMDILNQMLINLKQVKTLNMMPRLNINLDKTRKKWSEQYKNKRIYMTTRYCLIPFIVYIGKILLYIFLAYLVINGKMTLDKLVLLISYFEMTITCTDSMLDNLLNLSNYGVRVSRIKTILDYTPQKSFDFGDIDNDYINGVVEFKNVYFSIKNKLILNKVSFKIYPNEINAIVGHSGSGKTSIVNLLYRLNHIKSGEILIDDESIYNYSNDVYFSNVSGVYQKPFIFEMSIRDNLSLIDPNVKNQVEACKRVGIHDFIEELPRGYNTVIADDAHLLSEGQKQLLVIARTLLSKAEILIFDEVTSNIDPDNTKKIADILLDLKNDHTIIMITHKPEMMMIADRIIVIDNGSIVAKGLNGDVYTKCELYRDLRNRTFASISDNN